MEEWVERKGGQGTEGLDFQRQAGSHFTCWEGCVCVG